MSLPVPDRNTRATCAGACDANTSAVISATDKRPVKLPMRVRLFALVASYSGCESFTRADVPKLIRSVRGDRPGAAKRQTGRASGDGRVGHSHRGGRSAVLIGSDPVGTLRRDTSIDEQRRSCTALV